MVERFSIVIVTTFQILLIFGLFSKSAAKRNYGVQCYTCIRFSCVAVQDKICTDAIAFAEASLQPFYQTNSQPIPICPGLVNDTIGWETLKYEAQLSGSCRVTCALGRFEISETKDGLNKTLVIGTVMGCASSELFRRIVETSLKLNSENRHQRPGLPPIPGAYCDTKTFSRSDISGENYGTAILEVEHCPKPEEFCKHKNYCIHPRQSDIRPFIKENGNKTDIFVTKILIGLVLLVGICVAVIVFLGMKYN